MSDRHDQSPAANRQIAAENASFNSARQHVGAAGFLQRDVLEQIINAGREQISVTRSLHQVVAATQNQLRSLSGMGALPGQAHVETLQGIVHSSEAQIQMATGLRAAIQRTLTDVRGTPLEEISAHVLSTLGEVVQRQLEQLQALITTALNEADSVEQVAELEQVRSEAQARQVQVAHEQSERDLVRLETLGVEALARVRELEEGGQTHTAQRAELEQRAETTRQLISSLEGEQAQNLAQLARLEQEELKATERQGELKALIQQTEAQLVRQASPTPRDEADR